jgi:hypothetical protein
MLAISDIKAIVSLGGGVSIDAVQYAIADIKQMASLAASSGATLILRNAGRAVATADIKAIASLAPGKVIFEL